VDETYNIGKKEAKQIILKITHPRIRNLENK
jgi:hypothetical protein